MDTEDAESVTSKRKAPDSAGDGPASDEEVSVLSYDSI